MLPSFIQSSYQAFREDLDILAKWLAITAKHCGCPADLLSLPGPSTTPSQPVHPLPNLKGAARKKAQKARKARKASKENLPSLDNPDRHADAARYIIRVKDFVTLAECIARFDKPVVEVPVTVVKVLSRAIELRRQNPIWNAVRADFMDVEKNNQSHADFLDILERTREILKPRMPSKILDDFSLTPSLKSGDQEDSDARADEHISKKFDSLDVQEPSQSFPDAPDVQLETHINRSRELNYEAEQPQGKDEEYLATHCLFRDVMQIRSFLHELWASYRFNDTALVAASLTTNTAIEFVRGLEQELLQRFPDMDGYETIHSLYYCGLCHYSGHDPTSKQKPEDSINFEVYDLAEGVMLPTYYELQSFQKSILPDHIPVLEPGHHGVRDVTTTWIQKSDREKVRDDHLVLVEAFTDLALITTITSRTTLSEDELMRGIRQMAPEKVIPLWLVFATQSFLDTQHVLSRDVHRGYTDLQRTATSIRASMTQNLKFHKSIQIGDWPLQDDAQIICSIKEIDEWVHQDLLANIIAAGAITALPPLEPFKLLKQYPLLCGLLSFAIQMRAQEVGIDYANSWTSIMVASHLYNATRQEKLLSKSWKDMELLIGLQSRKRLFVGDIPTDLDAYFDRFLLSMGLSANVSASNGGEIYPEDTATGPMDLSTLCATGALFKGRYCENEESVTWTTESMQRIVDARTEHTSDSESSPGTLSSRTKEKERSVCVTGFLRDLSDALHAETLELSIDYLRLHRSCWMLLSKVNEACQKELIDDIGDDYLGDEAELTYVVGYILMMATQVNGVLDVFHPKRPGVLFSTRPLEQAAAALDAMIDSGAGDIEIKFIKKVSAIREIDPSKLDSLDVRCQSPRRGD